MILQLQLETEQPITACHSALHFATHRYPASDKRQGMDPPVLLLIDMSSDFSPVATNKALNLRIAIYNCIANVNRSFSERTIERNLILMLTTREILPDSLDSTHFLLKEAQIKAGKRTDCMYLHLHFDVN